MGFSIHCNQLSKLTTRRANKVTGIDFDFAVPSEEEKRVVLHRDGTATWEDGTPYIYYPEDRRDTTVIGYPTISAVAYLLEYSYPLTRVFHGEVGNLRGRHGRRRQD
jgi:hypothetical protein